MQVDDPYILGFAGPAGSGKTASATALAPNSQVILEDDELGGSIFWTKCSFAIPIRKVLTIRQKTVGGNEFSRQCHQVHEVLRELVGAILEYDELVDLVYEVCSYPIPTEGKPREFMQWLGEYIRQIDSAAYVKWVARQVRLDFSDFRKEYPLEKENNEDWVPPAFGVVIDDVRYLNEVDWIVSQPYGRVIKLEVTPEEANRRLTERDGHSITFAQMSHVSEQQLNTVDPSKFSATIDTTVAPVDQVVKQAMDVMFPPPPTLPVTSAAVDTIFSKLISGIQ